MFGHNYEAEDGKSVGATAREMNEVDKFRSFVAPKVQATSRDNDTYCIAVRHRIVSKADALSHIRGGTATQFGAILPVVPDRAFKGEL